MKICFFKKSFFQPNIFFFSCIIFRAFQELSEYAKKTKICRSIHEILGRKEKIFTKSEAKKDMFFVA
jgi:competence CoiA-like predicted nuclease